MKTAILTLFACGCMAIALRAQVPSISIQTGHKAPVSELAFSKNGLYLWSVGEDQAVIRWEVKSGKQLSKFFTTDTYIATVEPSPDDRILALVGYNKRLQLLDAVTGLPLHMPIDSCLAMCFASNDVSYVVTTGHILKFNLKIAAPDTICQLTHPASMASFSSDGAYATVFYPAKKTLEVIELAQPARRKSYRPTMNKKTWLYAFKYYPKRQYLVIHLKNGASLNDRISVLDMAKRPTSVFDRHPEAQNLNFLAFDLSPDGQHLAIGVSDYTTWIWDLSTSRAERLWEHFGEISAVKYDQSGQRLATGSFDRSICLFDQDGKGFSLGKRMRGFVGRKEYIRTDGPELISGDEYGRINLQNLQNPLSIKNVNLHHDKITAVLQRDHTLISASHDGLLNLYDPRRDTVWQSIDVYKSEEASHKFAAGLLAYNPITWLAGSAALANLNRYRSAKVSAAALSDDAGHTTLVAGGRIGLQKRNIGLKVYELKKDRRWRLSHTIPAIDEKINGVCFLAGADSLLSWGGAPLPTAFRMPRKIKTANTSKVWLSNARNGKTTVFLQTPFAKISSVNIVDSLLIVAGVSPEKLRLHHPKWGKNVYLYLEKIEQEDFPADTIRLYSLHDRKTNRAALYALDGAGPFHNRHDTLFFTQHTDIVAYHLADRREIGRFKGHSDRVTGICSAGGLLLSSSWDGTIRLWDISTNKLVMTLIQTDNGGFILLDTLNRYFSSKSTYESIGFNLNNRYIGFDNFDLKYNRPDLVLGQFKNVPDSLKQAYYRAYQKRLEKMGIRENRLADDYHIPTVEILTPNVPGTTPERRITLAIRAADSREKLDRLHVYINNVPIFGKKGIDLRMENSSVYERPLSLELAPGANLIQVSVLNQAGAESIREAISITCTDESSKPTLHFIGLGIGKFKNSAMNLKYPQKDVRDLVDKVFNKKNLPACYQSVSVDTIMDEALTMERLRAIKQKLMQTKVTDHVILYMAGHGLLDEKLDYYFALHDTDFDRPDSSALPFEAIEELLDGIPARQKLLLVDACHAGEIDRANIDSLKSVKTTAGEVVFRSFGQVQLSKRVGLQNSFDLMKQLFLDLRRGGGASVIAAADGVEFAHEGKIWNNSVFVFALIEALTGQPNADLNKDKSITVSELETYLAEQVKKLSNGQQQPLFRSENLAHDWQVW